MKNFMKRNKNSNRSLYFIKRNSPNYKNCREYVSNLLENVFNIYDYEFKDFINDEVALFINYNGKHYVYYIDYEFIELKLSCDGVVIKMFQNDSCWYRGIKYIVEENKK